MNIVSQKHPTRIIVFAITVTIAALLGFLIAGRQAHAESVTASSDSHIVTVHDDGVDKGFITNKPTLREALQEADIPIDPKDRTEPALDEKLVARSYQVNVYRARPVLVIDGANQFKVITSYRTGKQIAKEAGLSLHEEDIATLTTATDITETGAAEVLHVKRATKVTFVFYGKSLEVHTFARTVGELVSQKSIIPQANDTLMPAASAPVVADMKIELWRNGEQTVTVDEEVPFSTEQVKDANRATGFKEVKTAGVNGKKSVTYKITMHNGKEVKREVINSVTTEEPIKQVETVGTKVELPAGSHSDWMRAAGISEGDFGIAEWLIQKESGWNPNAVNKSSGACGLVQALPCSKLGPNWNDPVVALRWGDAYVKGRYGSWSGAYAFWSANHWY
jgi:uncharacterized protein YabE (DUF348 family)